uniref:Uncharacterized protein n=1 Tax=Anopheles atroparvus TaxID=41427 RepID=A0A182JFV3_ANOAO
MDSGTWTVEALQLFTVMFFEIILPLLASGLGSYCSQQTGNGAMVYVESLKPVQTVSGHMRISVRVDLTKLRRESELFVDGFVKVRKTCEHLLATEQHDLCERILYVDQQTYRSIVERMEYINSMAPAKAPQQYRSARSLDSDADSTPTRDSLRKNATNRGDQFLANFQHFLNSFDNDTMEEVDPIALRFVVKKLSATLVPLARVIEFKQTAFLELLQPEVKLFNVQNFLQLISPAEREQLFSAIRNNSANFYSPIGRTDRDVWEVLNAGDSHCIFEEDFVVVRLRVPIVSPIFYEAIKVTVLPQIVDDVLAFSRTDHDVLLIDRMRNVTLSLDHGRYRSNCKHLPYVVLCDFKLDVDLGKVSTRQHNCLRSLLLEGSGALCHSVLMRSASNFWLATLNPNIWLYILPFRETVAITLNGRRSINVLNNVGVFELQPKMKIQIGDRVLRYTESSANGTGRIVSLGLTISNKTHGLLKSLSIPLVKMHDTVLVTEKEQFELSAQAMDERILIEAWSANQEAKDETRNVILYHVLAVLVVLMLVLARIALSVCGKAEKPADDVDHSRAMTTLRTKRREVKHSILEVEDHRRRPSDSTKVDVNDDLYKQGNKNVLPLACTACK